MKTHPKVTIALLMRYKGKHIQLAGLGATGSIFCKPTKQDLLKIEELRMDRNKCVVGVYLRRYRSKILCWLSIKNFDQKCRIFSRKKFAIL